MDDSSREPSADRVALEMKLGFLEHTVDALNEVILTQADTIDRLESRLAKVEQRLAAASETEPEEVDPLSERPPHY